MVYVTQGGTSYTTYSDYLAHVVPGDWTTYYSPPTNPVGDAMNKSITQGSYIPGTWEEYNAGTLPAEAIYAMLNNQMYVPPNVTLYKPTSFTGQSNFTTQNGGINWGIVALGVGAIFLLKK